MHIPLCECVWSGRGEAFTAICLVEITALRETPNLMTPPLGLPVATALNHQLPTKHTHTSCGCTRLSKTVCQTGASSRKTSFYWSSDSDIFLPAEVLDADAMLGISVNTSNQHLQLRVKQQHKRHNARVSAHTQQKTTTENQL